MTIGIDVVDIEEFSQKIVSGKQAFLNRYFCRQELHDQKTEHLAGIFAAKEAIFKTGYFSKFDCLLIQITKDENNVPIVIDSLSSRPISNMHLSISHSKKTAVAIAIWETKK